MSVKGQEKMLPFSFISQKRIPIMPHDVSLLQYCLATVILCIPPENKRHRHHFTIETEGAEKKELI